MIQKAVDEFCDNHCKGIRKLDDILWNLAKRTICDRIYTKMNRRIYYSTIDIFRLPYGIRALLERELNDN